MKKGFLIMMIFVLASAFTALSTWHNDDNHSQVTFTVTHLGINDVSGVIHDFDIAIDATKPDFSDGKFTFSGLLNTLDTGVEARNNHLKTADFFDVEKYAEVNFTSTSIKSVDKNVYDIVGDLNLHGVTKPITLRAFYRGSTINPMSNVETAGFQFVGEIKRSDFGIGDKFPEAVISDNVRILINAEFTAN